jgi:hypothetical protein
MLDAIFNGNRTFRPAFDLSTRQTLLIIILLEQLEAYMTKPDCFRQVAGTIRSRCGEADMAADERVSGAVFTLIVYILYRLVYWYM